MTRANLLWSIAVIAAVCVAILTGDGYQVYVLALVALTAIVGVGLNILLGLTGQISLGHVGFYAIGAYVMGILSVRLEWSFWVGLPLAGLAAAIAGAALAVPALRVRGPYLAMVTIAFGFVVEQGAAEWRTLTGGWNGLMGISPPSLLGHQLDERGIAFLSLALCVAAVYLYSRLSSSPWGQAMRAIRDSEVAGQSIGLNPVVIRTVAFTLSAMLAGIAGAVFASLSTFISPESFPFFQSILFLLVVMIGGADRVLGPVLGAVVVVLLPEVLSFLAGYRLLFVGALLLVVLWLAPDGIVGLATRLFKRRDEGPGPEEKLDVAGYLAAGKSARGLAADGLSISFGGVHAVKSFSFEAPPGRVTSIIGPNGAGKTTVLNLVCGFYKPDAGSVRLNERDVAGRLSHDVARAGIARTYQSTQLFDQMSVLENVLIALRRGRLPAATMIGSADDREAEAIAESLLAFVGYKAPLERKAGALPHVDKRLVEIARALAMHPTVLLLDEPAAGLGKDDTARLGGLLRQIAERGIAVILVEHDMSLVMEVSDRVLVLDAGEKIAEGTPAEVRTNPEVLKAYLGEEEAGGRGRPSPWTPQGEPVLEGSGIHAGYGAAPVLRDVAVTVHEGELVAVLGANGAGKSTLMRALSGLHRPIEGRVLLIGQRVESLVAHRIARAGLSLVPEGRQVFPELSVIDNIRLGAFARSASGVSSDVEEMFRRFPQLRERRLQKAGLLSGGEQQMLAIARGLMAKPRVLMLDEPSLGLAPALINDLFAILAELRDEGVTILLVDQMAGLALGVADRGYVLESGAITHSGPAQKLAQETALDQAYLGEARGSA